MFLTKDNNELNFNGIEQLNHRQMIQLLSLAQGRKSGDRIISSFDLLNVIKVLAYCEKNDIEIVIDNTIKDLLNIRDKESNSFKNFSEKALNIKNAKESYNDFSEFIKKIDSLMTRKLYDFQARAAYYMTFSMNSCNFSVPGAGKTSVVYASYAYLKNDNKIEKLLIIGPLSSVLAWEDEYSNCFSSEPDLIDLSRYNKENKRNYFEKYNELHNEITFINYESLIGLEVSISKFLSNNKVMLVLDEAHKIKNPNAKRSNALLSFSNHAKSRIILTGTPLTNGLVDLYNLFEFIWPKKNLIGYNPVQLRRFTKEGLSVNEVGDLLENIDPYYIRIAKKDLNLPDAIFNDPIIAKLSEVQQEIYGYVLEDFLNDKYSDYDDDLRYELKKGKLIRLMQTLTDPSSLKKVLKNSSFEDSKIHRLIMDYESIEVPPKYIEALTLVKKILLKQGKVIIWAQFKNELRSLQKFLAKNSIDSELLFGETDSSNRIEIIREFHKENTFSVLIANPAAVAESISLHKTCHNAIYLSKSFNAGHYMQSKDRIHRVGLPNEVETNYYFILTENTIDGLIHERILEKEGSMLSVIEGKNIPLFEENFGSDISENDIQYLEKYFSKVKP
jgi:SNF2 family DNA or RNA helicase